MPDDARHLLRHTLATLAYRAAKTVRDAPAQFAAFRIAEGTRTPAEILAHMGDTLDWGQSMARGRQAWKESTPRDWDDEVRRFFDSLSDLDAYLASGAELGIPAERIFSGPIADSLTHVGQIAMLRRLAGWPVRGENYAKAEIVAGRVGLDQAPARREFD